MSVKENSQTFVEHAYWYKNGDATPWLGEGTTYDGVITTAQSALAVDGRSDATVEAIAAVNKVLIKPQNGTVALEFRFRSDGTSDGDQEVLNLYAAAGVDFYTLVDTLTIDRGTMEYSSTIFFYDKVASAGEEWLTAADESGDTTNNMGRYIMNTHGYDRFCFVMTTKDANTTNLYIDWRKLP